MGDISISVAIADRHYPLIVNESEAEVIKSAVNLLNEKLKEYSEKYHYNDMQDLMAMVALEIAAGALKGKEDNSKVVLVKEKLETLTRMVTEVSEKK